MQRIRTNKVGSSNAADNTSLHKVKSFFEISVCLGAREGPIRTVSFIPVKLKIPLEQTIAVYQKLAPRIKEMKALGMSYREIGASLGIDKKTVGKGLSFRL